MPQRASAPQGAPCWIELMTSDPERATRFYGELFGWTAKDNGEEFGGYISFLLDGVQVAGAMRNDPERGLPDLWFVYLASANAEATCSAAAEHGGSVHVEPMQVGELGTMAVVTDAGGAGVGIWQGAAHQGFGVYDEPNTPGWFELFTRDHAPTVRFYEDVFGWDTAVQGDTDEFRYTTLGEGDGQLAGVMDATAFLPEGVPAHWSVYFRVTDVDATLDRIVELGGAVVVPAEDTPYGRLATATDPTGAQFKLVAGP